MGGGGITSYIWYSMDVCAEWPLNSALPGIYDQLLFFSTKYMTDSIFLDSYMKGPTFLTSQYMRIFFKAACSLGIHWIDCVICLITNNKWVWV